MLRNNDLAGKTVATAFGEVKFNDKGETNDLSVDQQKELGKVPGFEFVAAKTEAKKTEDKKTSASNTNSRSNSRAKSEDNKQEEKKDEGK